MLCSVPRTSGSSAGPRSSVRPLGKGHRLHVHAAAGIHLCLQTRKRHRVKCRRGGVCVSRCSRRNGRGSQHEAISQVYLQRHPANRRILHPASIKNRSLTLPPAKTPSAPPPQPRRSKHTVKPTLTAPPCDTLLFRIGVSA